MKKIIAIVLTFVICMSFVACGGNETPKEKTPKEKVIESAEWDVEFILYNNGYKAPNAHVTTINETSENEFEFYGTFSSMNAYNQSVKGTFQGTGGYNPDTDKAYADVELN